MAEALNLPSYQPRPAGQDILYDVVKSHWNEFLSLVENPGQGRYLPAFVKRDFEEYLKCGILGYGFIRCFCHSCGKDRLVGFSCKRRGFCPSCMGRRMNDEAFHLVDSVLPNVPIRQWVLSLPYPVRYLVNHNSRLTSSILKIYLRVVNSWYKKQAKKLGFPRGKTGSVTFIQRSGDALNLSVHFHVLFLSGVYIGNAEEGTLKFCSVPAPNIGELEEIVFRLQKKVMKFLSSKGYFSEENENVEELRPSVLEELSKSGVENTKNFGLDIGKRLRRLGINKIQPPHEHTKSGGVKYGGFSLHAGVFIGRNQREKLEKLVRYTARGPIALERLSGAENGQLIYRLKKTWSDGTRAIVFTPVELIARLAALVPPPRANLVRYHGVLAPNSGVRARIVPKPKPTPKKSDSDELTESQKRERMKWAEMLRRTFKVDVMECPNCKGRLEQIATIKDPIVIKAILKALKIPENRPKLKSIPKRGPPVEPVSFDQENFQTSPLDEDQRPTDW